MKTAIHLFLCLLAASKLEAQTFEWAKGFGGEQGDYGYSVGVDGAGNVYTAGAFEVTVDFDPGSGASFLTAVDQNDIFIQKMDASGNFLWVRGIGGIAYDFANGIHVDAAGNSYITGMFQVSADFDPGTGVYTVNSAGLGDAFVLKLNPDGELVWVRSFGGSENDIGNYIMLDASGNIYTIGNFAGTGDFDPGSGTANLTAEGGNDIFVQKLDASGNFVWAKSFGGTGDDHGFSLTIDESGNVISCGYFSDTVDFDPGAGTSYLASQGASPDIFIQKMNSSGNFVWAKRIGGNYADAARNITTDGAGNVFASGIFNDLVDFNPGNGKADFTSAGLNDVFILKLDVDGNYVWARTFGSTTNERIRGIKLDADGNIYSIGTYYWTVDFDPGIGVAELTSAGSEDIFIHKMDAAGNFLWAQSVGGVETDDCMNFYMDQSNTMYLTGGFFGTSDFNPGSGTDKLNALDGSDIFVLKLSQSSATGFKDLPNGIEIKVHPNPGDGMVQVSLGHSQNDVEVAVTDLHGKALFFEHFDVFTAEQIPIEGASGVYFVRINTPQFKSVVKFIKE
ncbi:MAG: T9SS type A sorting domain-containing protein [Flavobacteriales bacterium]|nr:T9SS type A sorting domain-containing protein [Flavobacteriales bacterium]